MAMLQFGGAMCNAVARFAPRTIWRINTQQLMHLSSSVATNPDVVPVLDKSDNVQQPELTVKSSKKKEKSTKNLLVKTAFASLMNKDEIHVGKNSKDIRAATTVDKLLAIATNRDIARSDALDIMSILADWTNKKKITLDKFDKDPRFLQLCEHLAGKSATPDKYKNSSHSDLMTIIGLAGDDEAAKLVSTLSTEQMMKVMSILAHKRRRSVAILRALSFHISRCTKKLNIKQAGDLLYAMAVLNFPDPVLLEKASADLIECIPKNEGHAVVGSIVTSLGFLRYKNPELLDALCRWSVAEPRSLRPQYVTSLLLTLATVSYTPTNASELYKLLIEPMKEADLPASEIWIDFVWASVIIGLANPVQVASVLDSVFIQKLSDLQCLTAPRKIKLLNISAAAKLLIPNYTGPFLPKDLEWKETALERSKEKQIFASSIQDTLSNLFSSATCLQCNINTGMGFVLDAECYVDAKCNPLPIDQVAAKHTDAIRLGILALNYNDFCRGRDDPIGIYLLMRKLSTAKGYRIVLVPYTDYNSKELLVTRVKYIEQKIKSTIKLPSSDT